MNPDDGRVFPDIESVMMDWAETAFPARLGSHDTLGARVDNSAEGHDLFGLKIFLAVNLVTGADDGVTDSSTIDFDVFSTSRNDAWNLAEDLRQALGRYPHRMASGPVIDWVGTEVKPRGLPTSDTRLWKIGATYEVHARRYRRER